MQSSPAGLFLGERQALRMAHDLTDPSMTEEVRVHGRWFANRTLPGRAQGQHTHVRPRRGGFDDLPRAHTIDGFDSTCADADGSAMLEPCGWRPFMMAEFNNPIGRLDSPAPHFKPGLWHRIIVFAASRSGPCLDGDPDTVVCKPRERGEALVGRS